MDTAASRSQGLVEKQQRLVELEAELLQAEAVAEELLEGDRLALAYNNMDDDTIDRVIGMWLHVKAMSLAFRKLNEEIHRPVPVAQQGEGAPRAFLTRGARRPFLTLPLTALISLFY